MRLSAFAIIGKRRTFAFASRFTINFRRCTFTGDALFLFFTKFLAFGTDAFAVVVKILSARALRFAPILARTPIFAFGTLAFAFGV
jgi:hypothetical protein